MGVSERLGLTCYGVDFSSAPSRRKPITVAVGQLEWTAQTDGLDGSSPTQPHGARLVVERVEALADWPAFMDFLQRPGPWIGGFDLPFGQPRPLIAHYGWPLNWPDFVDFFCQADRAELRSQFKAWCDARPVGNKFAWRAADKPAGSSPAMRWTNPPVAWMMQAGVGRMLSAGLVFPAHRHPPSVFQAAAPVLAPDARVALEAYPGFTARQVTRASYKSDDPSRQTPERRAVRAQILEALIAGEAGVCLPVVLDSDWQRQLIEEGGADLLDAVICGLQAAHAFLQPDWGLPRRLDPLEGWICAVPG